jgi:hypothetical protein
MIAFRSRIITILLLLPLSAVWAQAPDAPPAFTTFTFEQAPAAAEVLNDYLWYHFSTRLGNPPTLFNKEYLLQSDMWLNAAIPKGQAQTIQQIHRAALLSIPIESDGYVNTLQHFSHSLDSGWPFPLWVQAAKGLENVKGVAAGWHFQPLENVAGWVKNYLTDPAYYGESAIALWELENAESLGIENNRWKIRATGPSPTLLTPEAYSIDVFNAPYIQLRWTRSGEAPAHQAPYLEWMRDEDSEFSADRRAHFYPEKTLLSTEFFHSIVQLHDHPAWTGAIKRIRINLAPGESNVEFGIDSFFTVYDTRHTINNPIFIFANWHYFTWTQDLPFLRENINRMRIALRYQQTVMGGLEHNLIRNTWPGHDGLPGFKRTNDGNVEVLGGHGIGSNYWDLLPFGHDDFYATYQYYRATLLMAEIEEAILAHPGWNIPRGALALDPQQLRDHAAAVKAKANEHFWNADTGRFYGAIDTTGKGWDYGFTFLNLDAIWYGIASDEHAKEIMDWLTGDRIVEGDTSTGEDIYHWRFGPRATTRRNLDWYGQGWYAPEDISWGGQVQDGGAVLGFSFYDLWARLRILGPEEAWQRLQEILAWEKEIQDAGGYRAYYADGSKGTTLQGGGTAGGLGIDAEFFESSLLPSIVPYGFIGIEPRMDGLHISPKLPESSPEMSVRNLFYKYVPMSITATSDRVTIEVHEAPATPITLAFEEGWVQEDTEAASPFQLSASGIWHFGKR